jgi:hypothetical protein
MVLQKHLIVILFPAKGGFNTTQLFVGGKPAPSYAAGLYQEAYALQRGVGGILETTYISFDG